MQSWYRPACHEYGPNNLLYASLLINVCIIYGVGRKVFVHSTRQPDLIYQPDPSTLYSQPELPTLSTIHPHNPLYSQHTLSLSTLSSQPALPLNPPSSHYSLTTHPLTQYVIEPVQALLMSWSEPSPLARNPLTLQPLQQPQPLQSPPPLQSPQQSPPLQQPPPMQPQQQSLPLQQSLPANQQDNPNSFQQWIGNITTLLAYNRVTGRHIGKVTLAWVIFTLSFSHLMWRATFAKVTPLVRPSPYITPSP